MKSSVRLDLEIKSEYLFNSDRKSWAILMRYVEVFVGINAYYLNQISLSFIKTLL